MPAHAGDRDLNAVARARADRRDPYVMYLVVRRGVARPLAELCIAAAQAALGCERDFADDPRWRANFGAWRERSFRKVTLRARPAQWQALHELDHAAAGAGDPVPCLPPRRRSAREPLLVRLQAYAATESELPPSCGRRQPPAQPSVTYVLRRERAMSVGKLMAQVAHGALMLRAAYGERCPQRFAGWTAADWPATLAEADERAWEQLKDIYDGVVVRDAGFTEVAPGSETVLALAPGADAGGLISPL